VKAFEELEIMDSPSRARPRMIAAQADGCAPIVRAFRATRCRVGDVENAATVAAGLRVRSQSATFLILADVYASGGGKQGPSATQI